MSGRLYDHWAFYYYDANNKGPGLKQSQKAIAILQRVEGQDSFYLHDAQTTLSNIFAANKHTIDQAIKLSLANYEWYDQNEFHAMAASEATNMVLYLGDKDRANYAKDALPWLDRAEFHSKTTGTDRHIAFINYSRSIIMFDKEQFILAIKYAELAREVYLKGRQVNFIANCEIKIALALIKLMRLNEANAALDRAEKVVPSTYAYQHLMIINARSELAEAQGDFVQALNLSKIYHKKWKDLKEEEAERGLNSLNAELGLKLEEERSKNLLKENELQKKKNKDEEVFRIFAFALILLSFIAFGLLIFAVQQRRLLNKQIEVAGLQSRLKDEQEARNVMAAKAAHHLNNPLQAISGLVYSSDAEVKNIWQRFQLMFPKTEERSPSVQEVFDSFKKSFQLIEENVSTMRKSLDRVNSISNELRVLSGIHGDGLQRTNLQDFWKNLAKEIDEDEVLHELPIKFIELLSALSIREIFVESTTFTRSIFYVLKEILQSIPTHSICEISMDLLTGKTGRSTATIHVVCTTPLETKPDERELRFCQHHLSRYSIAIGIEQTDQEVMVRIKVPRDFPMKISA